MDKSELLFKLRLVRELSNIKEMKKIEMCMLRMKINTLLEKYTYLGKVLEENGVGACSSTTKSNDRYCQETAKHKPGVASVSSQRKWRLGGRGRPPRGYRLELESKSRSKLRTKRRYLKKIKRKIKNKRTIQQTENERTGQKRRGRPRKEVKPTLENNRETSINEIPNPDSTNVIPARTRKRSFLENGDVTKDETKPTEDEPSTFRELRKLRTRPNDQQQQQVDN